MRFIGLIFWLGAALCMSASAQRPIEQVRAEQARNAKSQLGVEKTEPAPTTKPVPSAKVKRPKPPKSAGYPAGRAFIYQRLLGAPSEPGSIRTEQEIIRELCQAAHRGERLAKSSGPVRVPDLAPTGRAKLRSINDWLHRCGSSVFSVSPVALGKLPFDGTSSIRGSTLYLHVFRWPENGLILSGIENLVGSATALNTGEELVVQRLRGLGTQRAALFIGKPDRLDPLATVIRVQLKGKPRINTAHAAHQASSR